MECWWWLYCNANKDNDNDNANDEEMMLKQGKSNHNAADTAKGIIETSNYKQLHPLLMELVSNIRNEEQLNETVETIQNLSHKFAAAASLSASGGSIGENDITFIGECPSLLSDKSRFKNRYESKRRKRTR